MTNREKLTAQAQKYLEKGQYDRAIREYLKIVAEDEKDVRTWLKIGDLYVKAGQKPEAAQTYQKVARFYSDQGFYLKAVAVYKQILKIDPRLLEVQVSLAELYRQLGLVADAITQYEAVAAALLREGRSRDALDAHRAILELDPENVAQRIKLAELYSKEELFPEAVAEFSHTAAQLRALGRTDDFLKVAERLLFHDPDNRAIAKELAAHYIERGDARRALTKLQVSFKKDPRDMGTLELLAQAFLLLSQKAKYLSVLREMARLSQEAGHSAAADAYLRRIAEAEQEPVAPVVGSPSAPVAAPASATPVAASEPAPQTLPRPPTPPLRAAVTAVPQLSRLETGPLVRPDGDGPRPEGETREEEIARIITEADVFTKYGLYQKAVDHLQRVLARQPGLREVRERLYEIFEQIGQPDQAIAQLFALTDQAGSQEDAARYLGEVLRIDPDNKTAVQRWRQIRSGTGDRLPAVSDAPPSLLTPAPPLPTAPPPPPASPPEPSRESGARAPSNDGMRPVYEMTRQGLRERGARGTDATACYDLGLAYRDMGLFADAINEFRKALHSTRLEGQARLMIGVCLVEQERPGEALAELQRALTQGALPPAQAAEAHYYLGRAHERLGTLGDAVASYEQSLRLDNGAARDTRARLKALLSAGRR